MAKNLKLKILDMLNTGSFDISSIAAEVSHPKVGNYLRILYQNKFIERVEHGKYTIAERGRYYLQKAGVSTEVNTIIKEDNNLISSLGNNDNFEQLIDFYLEIKSKEGKERALEELEESKKEKVKQLAILDKIKKLIE